MPAVLKCHCHGIIFSWNTGNLLSAGKIPEKNIKQQFRIITGIIILHGILSRCQQYYIKGVLQTHRHLNLVFSDFMCRCVVCRSASVPLLCNILALAQETVRHKHRITANYPAYSLPSGNLWNGRAAFCSRTSGYITTCPCPLQVITTTYAIYVRYFTCKIKPAANPGLHCISINFWYWYTATCYLCFIKAACCLWI